ncbi:MAG: leucyl aminopeptidase [bacterium]
MRSQRKLKPGDHLVFLVGSASTIPAVFFTVTELAFIREQQKKKLEMIPFSRLDHWLIVQFIPKEKEAGQRLELCRKAGDKIQGFLNEQKLSRVTLVDAEGKSAEIKALAEGIALGTYQFRKYKSDREGLNSLKEILLFSSKVKKEERDRLNATLMGVCFTRDLVNEPNSFLTAPVFAKAIDSMARERGIAVEVLTKKRLEALKMGGLLGVNKGSDEPPAFIILEYKPAKARNKKPLVLIGKGIVYDSGGMNLKTDNHMEHMKNDMAGGAAVAGTMLAVAVAQLPVHVIGLIPATDNRPGPKAMVSGDVLKMHNGMTVEVISTDAEGRLILADALSYAKRYNPGLVIDLATLTGSAIRAIGKQAIAGMESRAKEELSLLKECGFTVYERIVEFPLWDDYGESLKSEVADIKNLGGAEAGAITAGKFLQKFTDYPYIHLDIAGPAFAEKRDSYRGQGGTGVGVRLLVEYIRRFFC